MKREAQLWSVTDCWKFQNEKKNLLLAWTAFLAIKIILIFLTPLSADEAYYWMWSQFPQLSYYDHPGFVSWLWGLGASLQNHSLVAKIPAVLLMHLSQLFFLFTWKRIDPRAPLVLALCLLMAHPMTGLGGLLLTPDLPLFVFWMLSFILFVDIATKLSTNQNASLLCYCLLGICLGLGFSSKYMMVLFAAQLLLWIGVLLFTDRIFLKKISPLGLLLVLLFGVVGSLPPLIWNFQNDWVSFQFQMDHGFGGPQFQWQWLTDYVLGTLILCLPFAFIYFKNVRLRDYLVPQKRILLFCFISAFFPFLFFLKSSFHGHVELNWPSMAYPFLIMLALAISPSLKPFKIYCGLMLGITFIFYAFLLLKPSVLKGKIYDEFILLKQRSQIAREFQPLWTCDYQSASLFSFYSGQPVYKIPGCSRFDFYDTRKEFEVPQNIKKFYLYHQEEQRLPKRFRLKWNRIVQRFDKNWMLQEIEIE